MIALYAHNDKLGYAYRVDVSPAQSAGITFDGCPRENQDPEFQKAADLVLQMASRVIPPPENLPGIRCTLSPIAGAPQVTFLAGGSLYGPISLIVIQLWAQKLSTESEGQVRQQYCTQLEAIRSADLSKVAASAEGDSCGDFMPVGGIEPKLRRLVELEHHPVPFCVLAKGQKMDDGRTTPDQFLKARNKEISSIDATDPVDALVEIYAKQGKAKEEVLDRERRAAKELFDRRCRALAGRIA